jgi:beta-lactamase regulating signal transducer with metallopeptidase domain
MPSLSQSPILQALGYAIANSLWQMAMVWIVYVLLNSIFKFKSETKFRIAVAAQITGFSWFLVTLQFYYKQCSQALELAESLYLQTGDQPTYVVTSEQGSMLSYFIKAEQVLPYLSVAYLLLLAFLTIRWFRAYRYTQLVRLNGLHKIDVDWKLFVSKVAAQLGIKQKVRIFLSEIVQGPVTIGFLKPVILVPIASINHLTPQQLEAVILHELAHIKRHDYILNILLSIIELGLFFNPFTRLITKSISKERENSCDDWVLQYQYNPSMYAEALLRIAVLQKTPAMAMYAVKTKGELLSRVQRMVHQKDGRFNYRHQLVALLLMTGILASIAWFDPSAIKAQEGKTLEAQQAVVLEPLAAKVDNPLFNPIFFLNKPLKNEVKETVARENERHLTRLKRELRTQDREFTLPTVLAPVAIENLKEFEKRLASVNKDVRKNMMQFPAQFKMAQDQVFHFDTLHFNGNMVFNSNDMNLFGQPGDMYWQGMDQEIQELQKSQKAIEDALKKGTISKGIAKAQLAGIEEAMKKLKEVKLPQVYSFAQGFGGSELFYRHGAGNGLENEEAKEETGRERTVTAEKRRGTQTEARGTNVKLRKAVIDSLKQRFLAKAMTVKAPGQPNGYVTVAEGAPYMVIDGKAISYLRNVPAVPLNTAPLTRWNNQDIVNYNYAYGDSEDECGKANSNERSRRVIITTTQGKNKTTPVVKPKKKTTNGCTATATAAQKDKDAEVIVVDVQLQ